VPLVDLPLDYLQWFREKGFPAGKLGRLLALVWQVKAEGLDHLFDPFREARGGRTPLHPKRRRVIVFGDHPDETAPDSGRADSGRAPTRE
jgi:hypothetical protein